MTQRIIISFLFLVSFSLGSNKASAGRQREALAAEVQQMDVKPVGAKETSVPVKNMPVFPAPKPESPHSKPIKVPHMEELPHIHRYHKERVKKIRQHHGKLWFLGQLLVVLCHLSLLLIAYMHLVH